MATGFLRPGSVGSYNGNVWLDELGNSAATMQADGVLGGASIDDDPNDGGGTDYVSCGPPGGTWSTLTTRSA